MMTDHPRACGANWKRPWRNYPKPGSSPRMRGKLLFCHCVSSLLRIIPAHAGQTRTIPAPPRQKADHPRACGANCANESALSAVVGSSPRMRGKPCLCCEEPAYTRIIPAHAGQTPSPETCGRPRTDHPRACGANYTADRTPCKRCGSSPRMRGKRFENRQIVRRQRIIPAHAGQTDRPASSSTTRSDHPRACGANVSGFPSRDVNAGSSPRMRGKPMLAIVRHLRVRIIPAHAGQTYYQSG